MACAIASSALQLDTKSQPLVRAEHVSRLFVGAGGRDILALRDITLEIEAGEFIVLVGPSGCGKSTLLRVLAGLDTPTSGVVEIAGKRVTTPPPGVVCLFQQYAQSLFPWRTVLGNTAFAIEHRRSMSRREIREKCRHHLELVGLKGFERHFPRQLSGGMQQRVTLARALVADPNIILMDEPFSSVDALTRMDLQELIFKLWKERKFTAILVTHDVDEAVYLADRVIVLSARPAVVAETVKSGLPVKRHPVETREDRRFLTARHRIFGRLLSRDETSSKDCGAPP
jgi:NitT/TauT family transport system ATP-binding protein